MLARYFINQELFNTALRLQYPRFFTFPFTVKTQSFDRMNTYAISWASRVTDNLNYFLIKLCLLKMYE